MDGRDKPSHDGRGMTIEDDIAFLERVPALRLLGRDALATRVNQTAGEFARVRSVLTGGPARK